MKKNWKYILFAVLLLLFLAATLLLSSLRGRIPSNDITVTGNTAGNLNNHGLFCELDGKVYFSNAYDNGCLYSMNLDETDMQKLTSGQVSSINAAGDYLYYFMDTANSGTGFGYVVRTYGVYRSGTNGKNATCLVRDACVTMQLVGDYLYYQRYNNQDFTKFYKVKTDKSENVLVSDEIINPAACNNGIIYYNGQSRDHYLYALDTRADSVSTVYEGNLWYPVYQDGYIYYMDVGENYRICRYSLYNGTVEILTHDRADSFNVGNSYIYYQKNDADAPALMRMHLDGSDPEVVAEGNYQNINITSYYVYFNEFNNEIPV
ncbi:MAG: DUF5050 domain-containing protein, partial [Suilimivivens sp.]